jgi:glycosyltransferase involved in cell wall biosynthesis
MRPIFIPTSVKRLRDNKVNTIEKRIDAIKTQYESLLKGPPEVSVVIPAYNEQKYILQTLQSLTANKTCKSVEIIVVNNNSADNTEELVRASGVICINEKTPGVTSARNAGLAAAKGKYILNADADSVYPEHWIEEMVNPLITNKEVCLTYGRYSFIPIGPTKRIIYFFYENIVDCIRYFKKIGNEEAVNVGGFSSGFRKEQGLLVNGFNHPPSANEDGYLGLKLRDGGFGKLHSVMSAKSIVWTTDRRIQIDGGFIKGVIKRIRRTFFNVPGLSTPSF